MQESVTVEERDEGAALVNAAAGVPLHRQLFLVLHDEIARGALAAGDGLPTEQSLCEQFGVSRITVRRALADLVEAGLIERKHGVGSFVLDRAPVRHDAGGGTYTDEVRRIEFESEVEVVEYAVSSLPRHVAEQLGEADSALHVLRLRRERRTGEPLMVTDVWLPVGLAETVTERTLHEYPLNRILSDAGVQLERLEHELTAEIAGPRMAQMLGTAIGSALIRINQVAFVAGVPHHFTSIVMSPNRSRVLLTQSVAELNSVAGMAVAHDVRRLDP